MLGKIVIKFERPKIVSNFTCRYSGRVTNAFMQKWIIVVVYVPGIFYGLKVQVTSYHINDVV